MLRIIGDVHGLIGDYNRLKNRSTYSVQIGDLGFIYKFINGNPNNHKFFAGNHDNYDFYYDCPYALSDFGEYTLGGITFFYIRGGFSIDYKYRQRHEAITGIKSWWSDEELSRIKAEAAFKMYKKIKPQLVLTHSCPQEIASRISNVDFLKTWGFDENFTTNTQQLLQSCFEAHQPDQWIFGHFHRNVDITVNSTNFICLPELGYIDL